MVRIKFPFEETSKHPGAKQGVHRTLLYEEFRPFNEPRWDERDAISKARKEAFHFSQPMIAGLVAAFKQIHTEESCLKISTVSDDKKISCINVKNWKKGAKSH